MRIADIRALPPQCAVSLVERSSTVPPEFVICGDDDEHLVVALWRRRRVKLDQPTRLQTHLLSYCAGGAASTVIRTDSGEHRLEPQAGSLILLRAGELVQWSVEADTEIVHAHIYIAPPAIESFRRRHPGSAAVPHLRNLFDAHDPWLEGYFRMLLAECERCVGRSTLAASDFLEQTRDLLLGHLLTVHSESAESITLQRRSRVSALRPKLVQRIADHVRADPCAEASVETLAALASMSVDHFSRAFQRATGQTPHQYVLQQRLDLARERLREDELPVALIAQRCGFASAAHFSSTFHNRFGMTPSQYRRRH